VTPPLNELVEVKVAGIGHGSGSFREIQNLGHLIKLGGNKFLHVGDVGPDAGIFAKFKLDETGLISPPSFLVSWSTGRTNNCQRAPQTQTPHCRPRGSAEGRENHQPD
jgi:hypothetical protein